MARYEGTGRKRGEPAKIGPLAQVLSEFLVIGVVHRFDEFLDIMLDGGAVVQKVGDVLVVRACADGREHATRVPVLRVEFHCFAQDGLGAVVLFIDLVFIGEKRYTVIGEFRRLCHQVEGTVSVGFDQRVRVPLILGHAALDSCGVIERIDMLAT